MAKRQSWIIQRGAVWYYRRKIPQDLLAHYAPKAELIFSLKVTDRGAAEVSARAWGVRHDQDFARIRGARLLELEGFTDATIASIAESWVTALLTEDDASRLWMTPESHAAIEAGLAEDEGVDKYALGHNDLSRVQPRMETYLQELGYKIPPIGSLQHRKLCREFLIAGMKFDDTLRKRQSGEIAPTPAATPIQHTSSLTLRTLQGLYAKEKPPKANSKIEIEGVLKRWEGLHGTDLMAGAITKKHFVAFKDKLLELELSPATVKKQLGLLAGVTNWAWNNDYIASNPAKGVKVATVGSAKEKRHPYSLDDLKAIVSSQAVTGTKGYKGEASRWLPLIALYTGARLEEIGQLRVCDIREVDGALCIDVNDDAPGTSLKNAGSRRRIPVHQELVNCGLLQYVAKMKDSGAEWLFPLLTVSKQGKRTAAFSTWWGRLGREGLGITDELKVFHSMRHNFKEACRAAGIQQEVHNALTGHSGGSVGETYGGSYYPMKPLADAIGRIKYEGLDLSHLYRQ